MNESRKQAIVSGATTFIGEVCTKDREHGDERYASSGSCVVCAAERVSAKRVGKAKKQTMSEPEVQALLLRGGPNTKSMAEAAGLAWYNHPEGFATPWTPPGKGVCHGIIGISGYCPLCGQPTPEYVKVELDLDANSLLE